MFSPRSVSEFSATCFLRNRMAQIATVFLVTTLLVEMAQAASKNPWIFSQDAADSDMAKEAAADPCRPLCDYYLETLTQYADNLDASKTILDAIKQGTFLNKVGDALSPETLAEYASAVVGYCHQATNSATGDFSACMPGASEEESEAVAGIVATVQTFATCRGG